MNWTRLRILNDLEFWAHQLKSPTASAIIRRVILIDSDRPFADIRSFCGNDTGKCRLWLEVYEISCAAFHTNLILYKTRLLAQFAR